MRRKEGLDCCSRDRVVPEETPQRWSETTGSGEDRLDGSRGREGLGFPTEDKSS